MTLQILEEEMVTANIPISLRGAMEWNYSSWHSDDIISERRGDPIYPTPPLEQDMTQGQFLSGV